MSLFAFKDNFEPCRIDKFFLLWKFVAMPGRAKVLTPKEINDIFNLLKTNRNQALFAIGIYTGMRIGEVIRLRYEQVYTTNDGVRNLLKVSRLKKKNTVYSEIPIHPKLRDKLTAYQKEVTPKRIPYLLQRTQRPDTFAEIEHTTFYEMRSIGCGCKMHPRTRCGGLV